MSKDETGEYIAAGNGNVDIGKGDFTVEYYVKFGALDLTKAAPCDGRFHTVSMVRTQNKTHIHGDEYIDGVLFCFTKTYSEDGKLETAQYTRADLVKG